MEDAARHSYSNANPSDKWIRCQHRRSILRLQTAEACFICDRLEEGKWAIGPLGHWRASSSQLFDGCGAQSPPERQRDAASNGIGRKRVRNSVTELGHLSMGCRIEGTAGWMMDLPWSNPCAVSEDCQLTAAQTDSLSRYVARAHHPGTMDLHPCPLAHLASACVDGTCRSAWTSCNDPPSALSCQDERWGDMMVWWEGSTRPSSIGLSSAAPRSSPPVLSCWLTLPVPNPQASACRSIFVRFNHRRLLVAAPVLQPRLPICTV